MTFRRGGGGKRRDVVEKPIVEALRALGAHVTRISGEGAPDILVRYRGNLVAFEVKSAKGSRTQAQEVTDWPIVRSVQEAIAAIGACPYVAGVVLKAGRAADAVDPSASSTGKPPTRA